MTLVLFMDTVLSLFTEFDMLKKPSESFGVEAKHLLDHKKVALTILLGFFAYDFRILSSQPQISQPSYSILTASK
ncbi:hypothetical protein JAAARDRAFT_42834 [Jaapia argillacea MUCL 33604]|uniref:Uncharacterized protein n=1 Tax=Jaapia argillacea MUCL 33604 TaxID=933084 RepID=A0A067PGB7_9AGAM|nr:hypothetical protein JAAARDRAFT_42834 [Jaapia argillacea MUCL 33604]